MRENLKPKKLFKTVKVSKEERIKEFIEKRMTDKDKFTWECIKFAESFDEVPTYYVPDDNYKYSSLNSDCTNKAC